MSAPLPEDVEFLAHYGVKGMRWGVRNDRPEGVSRSTNRDARKDAAEFARAKMFFGEGAGTRRKLIKAKVDARAKRDPAYKKAFDHHLNSQDMSKHSDKARKERSSTDRRVKNKQRAGAVARRLTGEMGTQAAFVAVVAGGAAYLNSGKGRQHMDQAMRFVNAQRQNVRTNRLVNDLRRSGMRFN